jgi:GNAT superfamily N-acetyltransferase
MRGRIDSFLPGKLWIERGAVADFAALERFHYRNGRPATWAGVWVVRYRGPAATDHRPVAVAVLSYPCLNSAARDAALNLAHLPARDKIPFVNQNVRTISRVIVHPQFRSLGLASRLVTYVCNQCPTRWVEAYAAMGKVHPFFEKGGMRKLDTGNENPVYYYLDRE